MPVPIAISVNMLGLRLITEAQARSKNGSPPHNTTGVANINWIQPKLPAGTYFITGSPGSISPIVNVSSGSVSTTQTQNLRVIDRSSDVSSSASSEMTRGSSVIPHMGHEP